MKKHQKTKQTKRRTPARWTAPAATIRAAHAPAKMIQATGAKNEMEKPAFRKVRGLSVGEGSFQELAIATRNEQSA